MPDIKLDPYVFFSGDCREAMEFYKGIFGGELYFMTYGEASAANDERTKDQIMHASLTAENMKILASDTPNASKAAAKITLCLSGADEEKLRSYFERLSQDVEVQYPLKQEFWGDIFGSVTDKYGVDWMVNISKPKTS